MAGISAYFEATLLNWGLNAVAATRPAAWGVGLAAGAPTSISGSEIAVATCLRQTAGFPAAASPAGSASNSLAMTFSFASAATVTGLQIWDTAATSAGNMLYYGNLATIRTLAAGDSLVFAPGSLVISLS